MRVQQLSKVELCELLKRIFSSQLSPRYVLNAFLGERYNKLFNERMEEFERIDVIQEPVRFLKVNKELNRLHNKIDYYLTIDEFEKIEVE
ncbi:MAG: hypothetical protein HDQ88_10620 [Clostridia bacterium]|nr:hypothetical protein [Clostridia bacterium]